LITAAQPWIAGLPRYARYGAWFFAIGSALPLLWLIFEGPKNRPRDFSSILR
jgi:hypothetical protein